MTGCVSVVSRGLIRVINLYGVHLVVGGPLEPLRHGDKG